MPSSSSSSSSSSFSSCSSSSSCCSSCSSSYSSSCSSSCSSSSSSSSYSNYSPKTVGDLVKACGRGINDRDLLTVEPGEWLEIINFEGAEIFPEVAYKGKISGEIDTLGDEYQLDLNSWSDLENVQKVYLEDSDGYLYPFDNWIYYKDLDILDLDPETSKEASLAVEDYDNYHIIWLGYLPQFKDTATQISLSPAELTLLKKICQKEALQRILYDRAKLDRYRTQVGDTNEYTIMAMIRDLKTELELQKRKIIDSHQVRSF